MPLPRPLTPQQAKRTLANRLIRPADRLRQVATRFGVRPYRVFLVWTTWDGEVRGEGTEREYARVEILPTPKVAELTSLQQAAYGAGVLGTGTLRVDRVSETFSAAQLQGLQIPGRRQDEDMPRNIDFWYELREDGRGSDEPVPARFRLAATPYRGAGRVCWTLVVEQANEPTQADRQPPFADR